MRLTTLSILWGGTSERPGGLYAEPHPPLTPKVRPSPASQSNQRIGLHPIQIMLLIDNILILLCIIKH